MPSLYLVFHGKILHFVVFFHTRFQAAPFTEAVILHEARLMPMIESPAGHKIDQGAEQHSGSRSAADKAVHADPVSAVRTILYNPPYI